MGEVPTQSPMLLLTSALHNTPAAQYSCIVAGGDEAHTKHSPCPCMVKHGQSTRFHSAALLAKVELAMLEQGHTGKSPQTNISTNGSNAAA